MNTEVISSFASRTIKPTHISFRNSYDELIVGDQDGIVSIINTKPKVMTKCLKVSQRSITSMVLFGKYLIAGDISGMLYLIEIDLFQVIRKKQVHFYSINCIRILEDEMKIITCSNDSTIKVLNLESFNLETSIESFKCWISSIVTSGNVNILSTTYDKGLYCIDFLEQTKSLVYTFDSIPSCMCQDKFGRLYIGHLSGKISVINLNGSLITSIENHKSTITSISIDNETGFLLVSSEDSKISIINTLDYTLLFTIEAHHNRVSSVCWCADHIHFASCDNEGHINTWRINNFQPCLNIDSVEERLENQLIQNIIPPKETFQGSLPNSNRILTIIERMACQVEMLKCSIDSIEGRMAILGEEILSIQ